MLNLLFAPEASTLAALAIDKIRGAWLDPFDPPTIIVPNPAVGKWLRVRMAGDPSVGCVANVRMLTLERFLWGALSPKAGAELEMIDARKLSQVVCALLDERVLWEDVYKPLRDYLCQPVNNNRRVDDNGGINNHNGINNNSLFNDDNGINNNSGINNNHNNNNSRYRIDPLKRVQLSSRIAQLFLEYEYNRPSVWNEEESRWRRHGVDARWLSGKRYFEGEGEREHEAWQMDLYRKVNECLSKSESSKYTTLPHLYRAVRERCAREKQPFCDVGSNPQVILFGVSKISHFHRNTLVEISQAFGVEMHVFLTNPCAEFWEDVDTSRRTRPPRRRWSSDSPEDVAGIKPVRPEDYDKPELDLFADEEDHALLKLWGAAGKENIYLWCPQAQWNFDYCIDTDDSCINTNNSSIDTNNRGINTVDIGDIAINTKSTNITTNITLLKLIQQSLLSRTSTLKSLNNGNDIKPDSSLQILACPDNSREVEEIREIILDMVYEKRINNFGDVAVYMPDPDKYMPYIERVFGAFPQSHPEYIPYTILGGSGGSSLVAGGLLTLLNIISGQFNRAQVFELLRNPIVMASKKISIGNAERWEGWAEEHGMFRGYNALQREGMGDMGSAVTDEHTFERGMKRVFESADVCDEWVLRSAKKFESLLIELNDLSSIFTKDESAIHKSVEAIRNAVWSWFSAIPTDCPTGSGAEGRVRSEALSGLDMIELQHSCADREFMGKGEFLALVRSCVVCELDAKPGAWCGVTFAPLKASMALPHRTIFAIGLGAAEFPGTNETGSWNLLSHKRIVGDSDRVRDNRFAFLELIHAAKECLVLSFCARDMQKDEALQPSSVILELEEYLIGQGVVDKAGGARVCAVRREIPWVVHESLGGAMRRHGTWDRAQREIAELSVLPRVRHRHELAGGNRSYGDDGGMMGGSTDINNTSQCSMFNAQCSMMGNESMSNENHPSNSISLSSHTPKATTLWDFKQFLRNPIEYHLCRTLGMMNDDEEGDMAATSEPMESGYKLFALRRQVWLSLLNIIFSDNPNVDMEAEAVKCANKVYGDHIASGQAPEGHICRMERAELVGWAKICAGAAVKLLDDFSGHKLEERREFAIQCGDFCINVCHKLAIIPKDMGNKHHKIGVAAFDKEGKISDNLDLWLDGMTAWVDEAQKGGVHPICLVALNHSVPTKKSTKMAVVSPMKICIDRLPDIEKWLIAILSQMLIENRCEHLPFKVVADIVKPDRKGVESYEERIEKLTARSLKEGLAKGKYYPYTDAFKYADALPPKLWDEDLRQLVDTRYGPILRRWIHE